MLEVHQERRRRWHGGRGNDMVKDGKGHDEVETCDGEHIDLIWAG